MAKLPVSRAVKTSVEATLSMKKNVKSIIQILRLNFVVKEIWIIYFHFIKICKQQWKYMPWSLSHTYSHLMVVLTYSGEADSNWCSLADMLKHLGLAVATDVMSHLKVSKCTCKGTKMRLVFVWFTYLKQTVQTNWGLSGQQTQLVEYLPHSLWPWYVKLSKISISLELILKQERPPFAFCLFFLVFSHFCWLWQIM